MNIPKARPRGNSYRIEKMINGERISVTCDTVRECERYIAQKILESKAEKLQVKKKSKSFDELLDIYFERVLKHRANNRRYIVTIRTLRRDYPDLVKMPVSDITPQVLTAWRNSRLKQVSASTVLREISSYSPIFSFAVRELFWIESNPFLSIAKPKPSKSRNRRISDDEIMRIITALDYDYNQPLTTYSHYVAWVFLFAIETSMRRGEILSITRDNIFSDYIHLPKTKNGESRDVPLLDSAIAMLSLIRHPDNQLIPNQNENSFQTIFSRAVKKAGVDDLHFHDSRHEAITRLVSLGTLPVEILMKITGHKTASILINTYYNPTASEISKRLNSR